MKNINAVKFFLFLAVVIVFTSCDEIFNNDDDPEPQDKYLVDYEFETSYPIYLIEPIISELSNQYPELSVIEDKVEYGVNVYTIEYNTTFQGEDVVASGLVCVPIANEDEAFPVMSYQNGTNTLHSQAPSVNPDWPLYRLLEISASTGFIISIPDYLGFGTTTDMFHPYLHEESTVQSVVDMLRAVDELTTNWLDVESKDELYISGYSQGGWATMQLQKAIEEQYASEFNLVASASAAGPYDLNLVHDYILDQSTYPMPYFIGYLFNSYLNLELISAAPDAVFNAPYASKIITLYDGSNSGEEINAELTTDISELFTADYISNYNTSETYSSVNSALEANSVDAWNASTPMMLIHGTDDEFVPLSVTSEIYQDFLTAGVSENDITLLPLPGQTHTTGIIPAGLASIEWFYEIKEQTH